MTFYCPECGHKIVERGVKYRRGDVIFNTMTGVMSDGNEELFFSGKKLRILNQMFKFESVSRTLLEDIISNYGETTVSYNLISVHISRINSDYKKVFGEILIKNMHSTGYMIENKEKIKNDK